ncbi:fasciclin domain-containing protein [Shimia sp.]|uniref:fasciclin domain-containing protein n=1 Tax=Shimia sp. TaxID=1954381 RepID=UPI003BA8BECA
MNFFEAFLKRLLERLNLHNPEPAPPPAPTQTIAEIASTNGNFDILVAALNAAGLTQTFLDPGDFTVFAPTDEAFEILARDTLGIDTTGLSETQIATEIVNAVGVPTLTNILFYHVQAGSSSLEDVQNSGSVDTLLADASFGVDGDTLNDADPDVEDPEFVEGLTDIQATNGVIHVIDRVLLPIDVAEANAQPTIADIASGNPAFEALVGALVATGLVDLFTDPNNDFTVFAPTDDAFRALAEELGVDTTGLADADLPGAIVGAVGIDLVRDVLLYHVQAGGKSLADIQEGRLVETALEGGRFVVDGNSLNDADPGRANPNFVEGLTDIEASNGEIHVIDSVLLPIDIADVSPVWDRGSFGDDVQIGGAADDYLSGGFKGDDIQIGGAGNDRMYGRLGDDIQFGGSGNDRMFGGWGDDRMVGDDGNDYMKGGRGNDLIDGGDGNDVLRGGSGHDTLIGGEGDDKLHGGWGADEFNFTTLSGDDTISDFGWHDTIVVSTTDFADYAAIMDNTAFSGRIATIEGDNGSITLHSRYLDESDFVFI